MAEVASLEPEAHRIPRVPTIGLHVRGDELNAQLFDDLEVWSGKTNGMS